MPIQSAITYLVVPPQQFPTLYCCKYCSYFLHFVRLCVSVWNPLPCRHEDRSFLCRGATTSTVPASLYHGLSTISQLTQQLQCVTWQREIHHVVAGLNKRRIILKPPRGTHKSWTPHGSPRTFMYIRHAYWVRYCSLCLL